MKRGFTLIEVMVATAVLAFGVVLVFEAFFVSMNSHATYTRYMTAGTWMHERIWEAQDALMRQGPAALSDSSGQLVLDGKPFEWQQRLKEIDGESGLYGVDLDVSWTQGARRQRLMRTAYIFQKIREEKEVNE